MFLEVQSGWYRSRILPLNQKQVELRPESVLVKKFMLQET